MKKVCLNIACLGAGNHAFKNTLDAFVTSVIKKKVERSHEDIIKSISLIELF